MINNRTILMPTAVLTAALLAGSTGMSRAAATDDVAMLKEQVAALQNKITELEGRLADRKPAARPVPVTDEDYYDPFYQMDAMDRQMQALMGAAFGVPSRNLISAHAASFAPDYDVKATDKQYLISFDMPGMDKAKINVEVKNGVILVSGERSSETKEDQAGKFYRQERSFGYFSRSIPLPKDAKAESLQAKYDNGVLTLTLDKKEVVKPVPVKQKIEVK